VDGLHLKPALPDDERPHEHGRSHQHHTNGDVVRTENVIGRPDLSAKRFVGAGGVSPGESRGR
jgi:hypothetical protein